MQKIRITINDGIPPETALECVKNVVKEGRISNGGKIIFLRDSIHITIRKNLGRNNAIQEIRLL